jgi:hypothetical protein
LSLPEANVRLALYKEQQRSPIGLRLRRMAASYLEWTRMRVDDALILISVSVDQEFASHGSFQFDEAPDRFGPICRPGL